MQALQRAYSQNMFVGLLKALLAPAKAREIEADGRPLGRWVLLKIFGYALVPFSIVAGTMATVWWYVVIHQQKGAEEVVTGVQQLGSQVTQTVSPSELGPPEAFYLWFWGICAVLALLQLRYYWRLNSERLQVVKLLVSSTMPLGILTVVVLAVILLGITTATEFGRGRRRRRLPAGAAGQDARLEAHQGSRIPDR